MRTRIGECLSKEGRTKPSTPSTGAKRKRLACATSNSDYIVPRRFASRFTTCEDHAMPAARSRILLGLFAAVLSLPQPCRADTTTGKYRAAVAALEPFIAQEVAN